MLTLEVLFYGFALWLGLYLIARDLRNTQLRLAGLGLVAYSLALATDLLAAHAPTPALALRLARIHWLLLFLPALFWSGATVHLLPPDAVLRPRLVRLWSYVLLPAGGLLLLLGATTDLVLDPRGEGVRAGPLFPVFGAAVLLPALLALYLVARAFRSPPPGDPKASRPARGVLLGASLFFALGAGLIILPLGWLPRSWVLLAVGTDLLALGLAIAVLDALDLGEALLPDFVRSFDFSAFAALLFGGQIALAMLLATGVTFPMLALLLVAVGTAIATQTFSDVVQTALDNVAFLNRPQLRQARADLRTVAGVLPRVHSALDPAELDEEQVIRYTRRAFSHYGNLPRLAANPLTQLPVVGERLVRRGAPDDSLERAKELKALLAESVARLKPRGPDSFGTSDEWRYYNALHFPYIAGLKPYSRRAIHDGLDPTAREALEWFRTQVPERTLYNWQSIAAGLVARDLLERLNDNN